MINTNYFVSFHEYYVAHVCVCVCVPYVIIYKERQKEKYKFFVKNTDNNRCKLMMLNYC